MEPTFDEIRRRVGESDFALIDVLPAESFRSGHLPGARSLPLEEVTARAAEVLPDRGADVVTYCAGPTCPRAAQAVDLLRGLGYTKVRHFSGGLSGWQEAGGALESELVPIRQPAHQHPTLHPSTRLSDRLVDLAGNSSFGALLAAWIGMVLAFGVVYWLVAAVGGGALREGGQVVGADLHGFWTSVYFSFVTATSIGFGDVVPLGATRILALLEGAAELLLFGAVVSKLVSRRQEQVIDEIHRIAFEDRLGRVRTNLHLVLSDLQVVSGDCEGGGSVDARMLGRVESAAMLFTGELRTIHDLLYRPQQAPEADVLESILVGVAAGLSEFQSLLSRCPEAPVRSPLLRDALGAMRRLAGEICGECVPRSYAGHLRVWMDRVQVLARGLPGGGGGS